MDTKVVNRGVNGEYNPWPDTPRFERIFVRDLSELTYNSARRARHGRRGDRPAGEPHRLDAHRINSLTANTPAAIRTPVHFPTDRECLERFAPTVGKLDLERGDLRLDPEFAGVGRLEIKREFAR